MLAASRVPTGVAWDAAITALAGWGGVAADVKAKQLQDDANKVIWNTYNHLGVQLFISDLKPAFRDEMLKAPPTDLNTAIKQARQLEKIVLKPENTSASVSSIQQEAAGGYDEVDAEIAALSAQFQALLKKCNGANGRGGRGLQMEIAGDEEAAGVERPEGEPQAEQAPTTCAGIAKSQGTSKKSATLVSKLELHKWTPAANRTHTHRRWRRRPKGQRPRPQGGTAPRCDCRAGNIVFVEELQVNKNLPTISINVMGNQKAEYRPFIDVTTQNVMGTWLYDTGASVSCMSLEQGSQTQNYTRAALRRKMSPRAAD